MSVWTTSYMLTTNELFVKIPRIHFFRNFCYQQRVKSHAWEGSLHISWQTNVSFKLITHFTKWIWNEKVINNLMGWARDIAELFSASKVLVVFSASSKILNPLHFHIKYFTIYRILFEHWYVFQIKRKCLVYICKVCASQISRGV